MTIVDLAFVPWNDQPDVFLMCAAESEFDGFSGVKAWYERMMARLSWKRAINRWKLGQSSWMNKGLPGTRCPKMVLTWKTSRLRSKS